MSRAREAVLARIRAALGVSGGEADRRQQVADRLYTHPANLVPERARKAKTERLSLFAHMLAGQGADVTHCEHAADILPGIADYLRAHNLPAHLRTGTDPRLAALPWDEAPALQRRNGAAEAGDTAGLSYAAAAAAETGTLFLVSGPDNPTSVNFLPDTHIVVVAAEDVFGSYEDAWNRLRATYGEGALPRTVNLVSGPSRTADIEQTIVVGAHGPRRLHVVIVGESKG